MESPRRDGEGILFFGDDFGITARTFSPSGIPCQASSNRLIAITAIPNTAP